MIMAGKYADLIAAFLAISITYRASVMTTRNAIRECIERAAIFLESSGSEQYLGNADNYQ